MSKIRDITVVSSGGVQKPGTLTKNGKCERHIFLYESVLMEKGGYIIVDFGKEICGRVHIQFGWTANAAKVRIRLGESVAETCAEIAEKNAGNFHSLRDNEYGVVAWGDVSTSESGFRFARIDVVGDEPVPVSVVYAEESENGLTVQSSFRCSDERINEIFSVAERTLSLCVRQDDIWDGVKRDRAFWMGDFYPELIGAYLLYGNVPQMEKALRSIADFDGLWVNKIPAYSAWWLVCLEKYYELTGNKDFVKELFPYVEKVVDDFSTIIDGKGNVSYKNNKLGYFVGNEFFLDWPTNGTPDSEIGWRYLLILTMQKAEKLFALMGKTSDKARTMLNGLNGYACRPSTFKQVTALGVLAGKIDDETARPLLKKDGMKGMTTFMSFAIIEALRQIGEGEYALWLIKEYYGKMLDFGATTFWEDFDVDWLQENPLPITAMPDKNRKNIHADYGKFCYLGLRHSLCHGWSSGFIDFFYRHILGIIPLKEGYQQIKIHPSLCGLTYAEGELPTAYGLIKVKHVNENGKIKTEISVPKGIKVVND